MIEVLSSECHPNGHYSRTKAGMFLGMNRKQIKKLIDEGLLKERLHVPLQETFILGNDIIKFFNNYK